MPKNDDFRLSRSSRKKEQRFDRFLNWAIGIVIVCILFVGGFLLVSIFHTPETTTNSSHHAAQQKPKTTKQTSKEKNTKDQTKDENADQSQSAGDTTDNANTSEPDQNNNPSDASTSYDTTGGGPQGPWHPIGTKQSEPHVTSYDKGTVDWDEKVKALSYATGIPEDQMTILWLGNGGGPDKSYGKVSDKQNPGKVYEVVLQWVTNKGWQPISVK